MNLSKEFKVNLFIRFIVALSLPLCLSTSAYAVDEILITAPPYTGSSWNGDITGSDQPRSPSGGMTTSNYGMAMCMQGAVLLNQACIEKAIDLRTTNQRYCSGIGAASGAIITLGGFIVNSAKNGKVQIAGGTLVGLGTLIGAGSAHCFLEVSAAYDKNELSCRTTLEANTSICKVANGVGY